MFTIQYRCGEKYKHDESHVGLKFKCSKCGKLHKVRLPKASKAKSHWFRIKGSIIRLIQKFKQGFRHLKPRKKTASKSFEKASTPPLYNHFVSLNPEYEKIALNLAKRAWLTSENKTRDGFFLAIQNKHTTGLEWKVEKMLAHARNFAPGLEVPFLTPKIEHSLTKDQSAGCFQVDEYGYASIKVDRQFMNDPRSTLAILSHEICHYVLESSGIRETHTQANEIQTDICMFVIGFGELFLRGYKRDLAMSDYRIGHKLGYLEDQEYWNLDKFIRKLRSKNDRLLNLPSENKNLKLEISRMVMGDQRVINRWVSGYEKKFPQLSEKERLEKIIRDIRR